MPGRPTDERTVARESYFLSLASELAQASPVPLVLYRSWLESRTAAA